MKQSTATLPVWFCLIVVLFFNCRQEDSDIAVSSSSHSFFTAGKIGDENLSRIVAYLNAYNDTVSFIPEFIHNYGNPLWDEAFSFHHEGKPVYVVPIRNGNAISTLWFFEMNTTHTWHYVLPLPGRDSPLCNLTWMFDYFNTKLDLFQPSYEGETMRFVSVETRGVWIQYCNDIYTGTEDNLEYQYTYCWTEYEDLGRIPGNGGVGGYYPDPPNPGIPGEGGGGGGTLPVPNPATAVSKLILSTAGLSNADKEKLTAAVRDMLSDCYASAIFNHLVDKGFTFNKVKIDPSIGGETAYSFTTGNLIFRDSDCIDAGAVYHEMFHRFQHSQGSYTGKHVEGMMEYERTLFEDIAFTVENTIGGEIPYEAYLKRKSPWVDNGASDSKGYRNWLKEKTKQGKSYPTSISIDEFRNWALFFGTHNRPYRHHDYTVNYTPTALMSAIELTKNNCK